MNGPAFWVFGYGSLIWYLGEVNPIEKRVGYLEGWHRDWTWISRSRGYAPTCSLIKGGKVKGVYLRLNAKTRESDLELFRTREIRSSEETAFIEGIPGIVYFWKMGNNLEVYNDTRNLNGRKLYTALAKRANNISLRGRDGKTPSEYAYLVHEFDPDDKITEVYIEELERIARTHLKE